MQFDVANKSHLITQLLLLIIITLHLKIQIVHEMESNLGFAAA